MQTINKLFPLDSSQIITIINNPDGQWTDTSNESQLKSTLKKQGKKGAKRVDHVSFEMTQIQQPRNSALMYGGKCLKYNHKLGTLEYRINGGGG